jgi:hypothetical protein
MDSSFSPPALVNITTIESNNVNILRKVINESSKKLLVRAAALQNG